MTLHLQDGPLSNRPPRRGAIEWHLVIFGVLMFLGLVSIEAARLWRLL